MVWIGLFFPLFGFLILLASSFYANRKITGIIACTTIFLSFLSFCYLFFTYSQPIHLSLFNILPFPSIKTDFAIHIDLITLNMCLVITGVGFLIHVYSNGYMDEEPDFIRYFACLNFFIFSMLLLVLAANLLLLYVGWEAVGLASYLLIGFWYHKPAAAQAATKAFVINRIGDLGLLLGLLLTYQLFGTSNIDEIIQKSTQGFTIGAPILTLLTLLYFFGATGKSAQIPLYTWLPDAMEGPTPVSALIHAATMVTAGVYLVVRMHPVFLQAPLSLYIVGAIGAITSLFAALCATGQIDLKRVLAYSTISQLGFMFLACGVGAFYAAMFHLTTHAFIKALLFLSAGNVLHMIHETDMDKMGGLNKILKKTHWLFLIGVLALSGIPPLAAFFSKDLILENAFESHYWLFFILGLLASILTGYYLTRAYCLTFTGETKKVEEREAPNIMLIPVTILAFLSIVGGVFGYKVISFHNVFSFVSFIALIGAILGIAAGLRYYKITLSTLKNAFYVDSIYSTLVVKPTKALANAIAHFFEPKIFDGSIDLAINAAQGSSKEFQRLQSGQIRSYLAWMVIGAVIISIWVLL